MRLAVFALRLTTALLVASPIIAQESDLLLKLECPSSTPFKHSDDFFQISLTNNRQSNLYIYKKLIFGMTLEVWDSKGHKVRPKFVGDLCPPPPPREGEAPFFAIAPGQTVSVHYDRSFPMLGITKPGTYTARALYFYATDKKPTDIGPSLTEHPLCSAKVTFKVMP